MVAGREGYHEALLVLLCPPKCVPTGLGWGACWSKDRVLLFFVPCLPEVNG